MALLIRRCENCAQELPLKYFYHKGKTSPVCNLCGGSKTFIKQERLVFNEELVTHSSGRKTFLKQGRQISREELITMYQEKGQSLEDIARTFGVTRQGVHKALNAYGIARRGKSRARILALQRGKLEGKSTAELNETLFSHWSQPMAYLLGYIFTDGSLIYEAKSNSHRVQISSIDRDHLEKLAAILGKNVPIYYRKQLDSAPIKGQDRYMIQFTRLKMIEDLRKLGLTERKTLTMKFPSVPEEFLRDFIRGCWDGDGALFIDGDDTLCADFVTASSAFIEEMRNRMRGRRFGNLTITIREPGKITGNVEAKNPVYCIRSTGKFAVRFCKFLYNNVPTNLMLQRKSMVYDSWQTHYAKRSPWAPLYHAESYCNRCNLSIREYVQLLKETLAGKAFVKEVDKYIAKLRVEKKWRQKDLIEHLHRKGYKVALNYLSQVESGRSNPSFNLLEMLEKVFSLQKGFLYRSHALQAAKLWCEKNELCLTEYLQALESETREEVVPQVEKRDKSLSEKVDFKPGEASFQSGTITVKEEDVQVRKDRLGLLHKIGSILATHRKKRGWTQAGLTRELGKLKVMVKKEYISFVETGRAAPSDKLLKALEIVYGYESGTLTIYSSLYHAHQFADKKGKSLKQYLEEVQRGVALLESEPIGWDGS